jgi:hypothetical protein
MQIEGSQTRMMKESSPYLDLLWYSITKFTAYGYFDQTASLWKTALESEPKHLKENLNLVVEKIFTKQYLNPLTSLEHIHRICQINCWNENSQYYQALSNTFDRYLTRRLHERNPPNVINESSRLQELSVEKLANTPHSPISKTDSHLQKCRYLLGLCALSRIQSTVNENDINQFYKQASDEFHLALELSKSTELLVRETLGLGGGLGPETGDVVTDTLQRKPKDNLGKTLIEYKFLEILKAEHTNLSNFLTSPTEAAAYHRKLTAPHLTSAHATLLHPNLPKSGAEGGNYRMNFELETHRSVMTHLMNEIPRHVTSVEPIFNQLQAYLTRFYSHLLPEKTSRPSPLLVSLPYSDAEIKTPPVYSHILLRHLYSLARAHTQRLETSTTRPINPLKTSDQFYLRNLFSQVIFNARYLRLDISLSSSASVSDDSSVEEEEEEEEEHSDDERVTTLQENFHHPVSPHLSDPSLLLPYRDYEDYFHVLESYGERLIDLSERSGVRLDGYFYANWIHSLPLCQLDSRIPTPWRHTSTEYVSKIVKKGVTEMKRSQGGAGGLSLEEREQQIDVIHHALICHLCSYRDPEAIEFAYETACDLYSSSSSPSSLSKGHTTFPVDIWNTLLTTAAYNCPGKFVSSLLQEAQQECSAEFLQVPSSPFDEAYVEILQRRADRLAQSHSDDDENFPGNFSDEEEFSTDLLTNLIQMKFEFTSSKSDEVVEGAGAAEGAAEGGGGGGGTSLHFDSNLAKSMLLSHFLTKNKYQSLRMMKAMQFHGYRSPIKLYRKLFKTILYPKEHSSEGEGPLESFLSGHPEITAPVIHEMMIRDGIRFDTITLAALGELFLYPLTRHQHSNGTLIHTAHSNGGGGVNILNFMTNVREFFIEACLLHHVTPNEHILKVLLDISRAGGGGMGGGFTGGLGGGGGSGFVTSQLLTFINEYNDNRVAATSAFTTGGAGAGTTGGLAERPPLIPTVAMLKLFPSSSSGSGSSSDWTDENGTSGSVILERWVELWAENEQQQQQQQSERDFEEVLHLINRKHGGLLPSPKSLKKLLAKEIKAKNAIAANRVGSVYLYVVNELEKRDDTTEQSSSVSVTATAARTGARGEGKERLQSAHEELQQLFEGYEIPFTISMKRIAKE